MEQNFMSVAGSALSSLYPAADALAVTDEAPEEATAPNWALAITEAAEVAETTSLALPLDTALS